VTHYFQIFAKTLSAFLLVFRRLILLLLSLDRNTHCTHCSFPSTTTM